MHVHAQRSFGSLDSRIETLTVLYYDTMSTPLIVRPLLSALQRALSYVSRRFIATTHNRSIAQYEVTVNAGLEEVARNEIESKFQVETRSLLGRVMFKTDSKLSEILKLRSVNNVFVVMFDETLKNGDMPTDAKSLESLLFSIGDRCDWRSGLEKWIEMSGFDCDLDTLMTNDPNLRDRQPKFRISSNRYGSDHKFTSPDLCSVFGHVVDTKFGWPIKLKGMDLDIYLNFNETRVYVDITLSRSCLAYRNITLTGLTTLKANTCYALLKKADIQVGDILVDPMAGSGAIPLECCACYHDGEMFAMTIGGELRRQTIKKCCLNARYFAKDKKYVPPSDFLRLDVTRLPFCDNSIDIFVSDLPFGHRHGSKEINGKLYPALLREMGRAARLSTGRAVLLTHDHKNMVAAYKLSRDLWTEISEDMVKVGNLKCFIYLYKRTSSLFVLK